ncbi:histidine phosphatase family protein [Brevibacillus humidisoli]|uniref:histidine phosphatase family protein n=1 Tax=Brevibacillus humidisoli TaxID=2895522 RepID=UPI001E60BEEE|nr:histidine phosphatase family protein [Brevibacillus humidisoli]UFJ43011.1 histidine phosphatase family protein [Brevibacillus humidisoli]
MKIFFIRHGESEHNLDRSRMATIHDSKHSLTERGRKQAQTTAQFMSEHVKGSATLFTSPYRRTVETARYINALLPENTPFHENPLLREWELGNLYDFQNRSPEAKREYKAAGKFYFRYLNGESLADVYLRSALFMQSVVQRLVRQQFDHVIVITHAAFIQMLLGFLQNWPVEKMENFQPVEHAAVIAVQETDGEYQYEKIFVPVIS